VALLAGAALACPLRGATPTPPVAPRLGGQWPLDQASLSRWCWCGAWEYPVGNPLTLGVASADGVPGYRVNRNVGSASEEGPHHQGADLDNRRGGDDVRAAAHGLVISCRPKGWNGGYGGCVVLAHRLPEGGVAYSVYAHLVTGSPTVRAGDLVTCGQTLGRVGRTGRATTTHLHFEVRLPADLNDAWENARVVDPIAFVAARLPVRGGDSTWAGPYLAWGERAALVPPECESGAALTCAGWWRMVARASRNGLNALPPEAETLRDSLIAAGAIERAAEQTPDGTLHWKELAKDVEALRRCGLRLPAAPVPADEHRARCEHELGTAEPARHASELARRHGRPPTAALACLLLADLARSTADAEASHGAKDHARP